MTQQSHRKTQLHFGEKDSSLILVNYILKLKADKEQSLKDVAINVKDLMMKILNDCIPCSLNVTNGIHTFLLVSMIYYVKVKFA